MYGSPQLGKRTATVVTPIIVPSYLGASGKSHDHLNDPFYNAVRERYRLFTLGHRS